MATYEHPIRPGEDIDPIYELLFAVMPHNGLLETQRTAHHDVISGMSVFTYYVQAFPP